MRRALSAVSFTLLCPGVESHAYVSVPKSRNAIKCAENGRDNHWCTAHIYTGALDGMTEPVYPNNLAGQQPGTMRPNQVCSGDYYETQAQGTGIHVPGAIQGTYQAGDWIDFTIEVQANHAGAHAFRLCPNGEDEDCFRQHMLKWESGNEWEKFVHDSVGGPGPGSQINGRVKIPDDLCCENCVLNWRWDTGEPPLSGESSVFLNCIDIKIVGCSGSPSPPSGTDPAPSPSIPSLPVCTQGAPDNEDCSSYTCCEDTSKGCFRKNQDWATCMTECTPGINAQDPPQWQTPWSCEVIFEPPATPSPKPATPATAPGQPANNAVEESTPESLLSGVPPSASLSAAVVLATLCMLLA